MLRVLLLTVLVILIGRALWRLMDGVIEAVGGTTRSQKGHASAVKLVRDPVCGTFVAPRTALSLTSGAGTHYFCSDKCRAEFQSRS